MEILANYTLKDVRQKIEARKTVNELLKDILVMKKEVSQ